MEKLKRGGRKRRQQVPKIVENPAKWMVELAEKYEIDPETVLGFYNTVNYDYSRQMTKRQRTIEFFDLYFEGVKEGI